MEYAGYGIYEGQPSAAQIEADAVDLFDCLTDCLNVPADKIIIYGRSIGSGPAITVAA
jgi:hypothetical protein